MTPKKLIVHAYHVGCEVFAIGYWGNDKTAREAACRQLGQWAANPDLSFTWYHAAHVAREIRKEKDRTERCG